MSIETSDNTIKLITLIIAIYGAVFSTIAILFAIKRHKPSIKLKLSEGFLVGKEYEDKNTYLFWNASNDSTRNITLNTVGFILKGKIYQIFQPFTGQEFPCELKDGKCFTCWTTVEKVAIGLRNNNFKGLVKIRGFFTDATGRRYYSKPCKFDIEKNLKNNNEKQ